MSGPNDHSKLVINFHWNWLSSDVDRSQGTGGLCYSFGGGVPSFTTVLTPVASATCGQPQSENSKWEIKQFKL